MDIKTLSIQIVHIFVLGVFLLTVGITRPKQDAVYHILLVMGILVVIWWIAQLRTGDPFWIVWHFIVAGVLLSVGLRGRRCFAFQYKLLIILGSAAIGYHSVRLVQSLVHKKR